MDGKDGGPFRDERSVHLFDCRRNSFGLFGSQQWVGSEVTSDELRRVNRTLLLGDEERVRRKTQPIHDLAEVLEIRDVPTLHAGQRVERDVDLVGEIPEATS